MSISGEQIFAAVSAGGWLVGVAASRPAAGRKLAPRSADANETSQVRSSRAALPLPVVGARGRLKLLIL